MATEIEEYYVDNSSEYMDIDEEEIDWNERILEMEEDELEESDETEENDEDSDEDSEDSQDNVEEPEDEPTDDTAPVAIDKKKFRTIKLTDKYISQQLTLQEFARDRFRFRYKGEVVYGHIITISKNGKYIFDLVDIKTGVHTTKFLNGEFIDSY